MAAPTTNKPASSFRATAQHGVVAEKAATAQEEQEEAKPNNDAAWTVAPSEGVEDVMSALFSAVPSAIPEVGSEESWREIGDLERNTPAAKSGTEQLWVRGWYADGKPDVKNLNRMRSKGWKPRALNTEDFGKYAVLKFGEQSVISVNGMILMERSISDGERAREINRRRIAMQSAGANLNEQGMFDERYGKMFGSVKTMTKMGRDAADLIDH